MTDTRIPQAAIQADECSPFPAVSMLRVLNEAPEDAEVITYPDHPGMIFVVWGEGA
jgi:hypothetical protein